MRDFFLPHAAPYTPDFPNVETEPALSQPALPFRALAMLAIFPVLFSGCCAKAQPRFWKVRDGATKNGVTAYTVDTMAVPTTSLVPRDIRYVDSSGQYVQVKNPKMVREMTEQEWKQATSGAGYSLNYCGHRHGCWAKAKEK